jgi:hypothetical protein
MKRPRAREMAQLRESAGSPRSTSCTWNEVKRRLQCATIERSTSLRVRSSVATTSTDLPACSA